MASISDARSRAAVSFVRPRVMRRCVYPELRASLRCGLGVCESESLRAGCFPVRFRAFRVAPTLWGKWESIATKGLGSPSLHTKDKYRRLQSLESGHKFGTVIDIRKYVYGYILKRGERLLASDLWAPGAKDWIKYPTMRKNQTANTPRFSQDYMCLIRESHTH